LVTYDLVSFGSGSFWESGIVYGTNPNPVKSDNYVGDYQIDLGGYGFTLSNLSPNTLYYARAYAESDLGIAYGNQLTFTTYAGKVTDFDNNDYYTVIINGKEWMASNLKTTHYHQSPNDAIPLITTNNNTNWYNATEGAWTLYLDGGVDSLTMINSYGMLYNWYAVSDTRGLCPLGWHVPSDAEWTDLVNFLGGEGVAGGKLKSTRKAPDDHPRWLYDNSGATNEIGFSAFPAGYRSNWDGYYNNFGESAMFWTSSSSMYEYKWTRILYTYSAYINRTDYAEKSGLSVRCVKD
jgi:uncharacterized protein (TIGR02145 family)